MFAYARDTGRPLWRVAFDYESALTGATEAELRAYARQVLDICRHARQQGVRPDNHFIGVTDAVPPAIRLCGRGGSSSIWGPLTRRVWTP